MNNPVIEAVSFKLNANVSDADFVAASKAVDHFVESCDGFIRRRLSKGEDGQWLDHLEWASMEQAKKAGDAFLKNKDLAPFIAMIDMGSAKMRHEQLMASKG